MMSGIRAKNTKPEMQVRTLLHALGFRYRLHSGKLPGKPDIVLARYKVAIFVQGCFWHGHENCSVFRLPKSRTEFWEHKIGANKARDILTLEKLHMTQWRVIYVWECALKGKSKLEPEKLAVRLSSSIKESVAKLTEIRGFADYVRP